MVLGGLLEDADVEVVGEAADGLDGIARAEARGPDVVLMDWRSLDWTVCRRPRASVYGCRSQVVLFSLAEGEQAEAVARQAGASGLSPTGVSVEELCAAGLAA